jgi:hypothetical protein
MVGSSSPSQDRPSRLETSVGDRRPGRFQELRILQEEQVSVDDLRLIAPRPRPGLVAQLLEVVARGHHGQLQCLELRGRVDGLGVGDRQIGLLQELQRADGDPHRGGDPAQLARPPGRGRGRSRRGGGWAGLRHRGLVEAARRQGSQSIDGLLRVRARRPHQQLVTLADLQAGECVEAACGDHRRAGGGVAGEDLGVQAAGGADDSRSRAGMKSQRDVHRDPGLGDGAAEVGLGGWGHHTLAGAADLCALGIQGTDGLPRHPLQRLSQP